MLFTVMAPVRETVFVAPSPLRNSNCPAAISASANSSLVVRYYAADASKKALKVLAGSKGERVASA